MRRSVVIVLLLVFLLFRFRRNSKIGFPVLLRARWELVHMRQEHGDLPHIVTAKGFVPSRHAGIADTSPDGVESVPFGLVSAIPACRLGTKPLAVTICGRSPCSCLIWTSSHRARRSTGNPILEFLRNLKRRKTRRSTITTDLRIKSTRGRAAFKGALRLHSV